MGFFNNVTVVYYSDIVLYIISIFAYSIILLIGFCGIETVDGDVLVIGFCGNQHTLCTCTHQHI